MRSRAWLLGRYWGILLQMITVLGVSGSLRQPSHTHTLLETALGAARDTGARVELLDLHALHLPQYDPSIRETDPRVTEMRERFADADAYLIGTPEYHGSLSGSLKNLLDFLYEEVNGKLFGFVVSTGSGQAESTHAHLQTIIAHYHAWSLPYGITAELADFDAMGSLTTPRIREGLLRLGRDLTVYGEILHDRFARDRIAGGGVHLGFAPWHARS